MTLQPSTPKSTSAACFGALQPNGHVRQDYYFFFGKRREKGPKRKRSEKRKEKGPKREKKKVRKEKRKKKKEKKKS